jgi:uncharacterized protein YbjT (DUF2867 family)
MRRGTATSCAAPENPVDLFRCKFEAEQAVRESGMGFTILRATAFMEFWAAMIGTPILRTGKVTIFGRGRNSINFVRVAGRAARRTHVPLPLMRILAVALRPVNPAVARQIAAGVLMDTADMRFEMRETLGPPPPALTRVEDVARRMAASEWSSAAPAGRR